LIQTISYNKPVEKVVDSIFNEPEIFKATFKGEEKQTETNPKKATAYGF